jgi:hypothetical protein
VTKKVFKTKSGLKLTAEFDQTPHELKVTVLDGDDAVGWVNVDVWSQRKLAKVDTAIMNKEYRGKGIGVALYPLVNQETKRLYRLPLSSDDEGMRSDGAEALWNRLVSNGMAHKEPDRYVMEAFVPALLDFFGETR